MKCHSKNSSIYKYVFTKRCRVVHNWSISWSLRRFFPHQVITMHRCKQRDFCNHWFQNLQISIFSWFDYKTIKILIRERSKRAAFFWMRSLRGMNKRKWTMEHKTDFHSFFHLSSMCPSNTNIDIAFYFKSKSVVTSFKACIHST